MTCWDDLMALRRDVAEAEKIIELRHSSCSSSSIVTDAATKRSFRPVQPSSGSF